MTVPLDQLALIRDVLGKFALRAGMPVEILIPLRQRTALEYALEPLTGAFWSSSGNNDRHGRSNQDIRRVRLTTSITLINPPLKYRSALPLT